MTQPSSPNDSKTNDSKSPSTEALAASALRRGGKYFQILGWVLIVCSVPLMLIIVGFFLLPVGIFLVWTGKRAVRNADRDARMTTEGLSAVGRTFRGRD